MKTALILTVIGTLALMATAQNVPVKHEPLTPEEIEVDEVILAARGFYNGFHQGLYKVETIDENCLSKEAESKILELFDAVFSGKLDLNIIMRVAGDFMAITASLEECSTQAIKDLTIYCLFDVPRRCTPDILMSNITKNMLLLMGKLTDLSTIVM